MSIDPNKLASFASGAGGPPPDVQELEASESEGDETPEEENLAKYDDLKPLLEQHAEELEACCDEIDPAALSDPESELSPEDKQILGEDFKSLPDDLRKEMQMVLGGIELEKAQELASELAEKDLIQDEDRTAGFLVRLGKLVKEGGDEETDEEDDGEDLADPDDEEIDSGLTA